MPLGLGVGKNGEGRDEEPGEGEVERTSPDYRSQPAPPGCGGRAAAGALARGPSGTGELLVGIHHTPGIRGQLRRVKGKRPGHGAEAAKIPHCHSRGIAPSTRGHGRHAGAGSCSAGVPLLLVLTVVCQGVRALRLAVIFRAGSASRNRRAAPLRGRAGGRAPRRLLVRGAVHQ